MTYSTIAIISCLSVIIPFLTGILVFKKIQKDFYPFFYFLFFSTVGDLTNAFLIIFFFSGHAWIILANINSLLEAFIITWIFKQWGLFEQKRKIYTTLRSSYLIIWVIENVYYATHNYTNSYFCSLTLFLGSFMSILMINKLTKTGIEKLHLHAKFIVCVGFVFYFFMGLIPMIFSLNFFKTSPVFRSRILVIPNISIAIAYLIFCYALIVMAKYRSPITHKPILS
jgi:hypothetical protein